MKYIFIDTNNYIYCSYLTKPDHTTETLKNLKEILNESEDVELLIPEVVELEFYKIIDNKYNQINRDVQKLIRDINEIIPDYLKNDKSGLIDEANEFLKKRTSSKKAAVEIFEEIIEFDNVKKIPLTSDIIINSHKRRIREVKPSNGKHNKDADCMIVESLLCYLKDKNEGELIFCSNNPHDFANNDKDSLHNDIKNDFKIDTKLYSFLYDLLNKEFEKEINDDEIEDIKEIDEESKIKENLERLNEIMMNNSIKHLKENDSILKLNQNKEMIENAKENLERLNKIMMNNSMKHLKENDSILKLNQNKEMIENANESLERLNEIMKNNSMKHLKENDSNN